LIEGIRIAPTSEALLSEYGHEDTTTATGGVIVTGLDVDRREVQTRLSEGMVILEINGQSTDTIEAAQKALRKSGGNAVYVLTPEGEKGFVPLNIR
jgi:hypothetical protein